MIDLAELGPVMQQEVTWRLRSKGGGEVAGTLYHTIHGVVR